MEGATTTRLRFKGEGGSSSRRSERRSLAHSRSSSKSRVRSRSRSPSHSSKKKRRRGSRSRSPSNSRSGHRDHRHNSKPHSSKYKITPAGFAPASLPDYDYLFDPDDYSIHSPEAVYLREQERERQRDKAYEQEQEQQEEERQRDPWLRHLFDELANDDSLDYHSSLFESHVPHHHPHTSHINALSDSDYTSYMRRGMRRSRAEKEAQEWEDWVQEQERTRRQQAKEDQKQKDERSRQRRQERKERERVEREANKDVGEYDDTPANRLWKQKSVEAARRAYEHGWQMLTLQHQQKASEGPLSMDMIPWPPLGATSESTTLSSSAPSLSSTLGASASTSELSLFDFLFYGTTTDQLDVRKRLLRREQLRFHPDKFKQRFGARMPTERSSNGGERERILAMVEKVARAFNEIGEALQSAS
ncbi:hypothetical protein BGX34_005599 [Mortierella sp. NVP85]|nr:hypothetical protein BGX34_005599 [Mortierella sp. NVP85]